MPTQSPHPEPDFTITADVYDAECGVWETREGLADWLDANELGSDVVRDVSTRACARWVTAPDGLPYFVAFVAPDCPAVKVCHECLHLGFFVLECKGVEVDAQNHEALAYLQDHLASQILAHYGRSDA